MTQVLKIDNLEVEIPIPAGVLTPVRSVSFEVHHGETLCIVGESGSGKSLTALSIMNLLPKTAKRRADVLQFHDQDLLQISSRRMASLRGDRISMIFQEPMTSLNPSYTIGNQLEEVYLRHNTAPRREARERAIYLLEKTGISEAAGRLKQYPHQLSGGLRQRVMIAMALMCGPELIIADEPTTALDVTIQAQILYLLADLQKEFKMGMILITHDLGVVARVADKVLVMYAGKVVEQGSCEEVFTRPMHPYTQGLLDCIPIPGKTKRGEKLGAIRGVVPTLIGEIRGCAFRNRCRYAEAACTQDLPEMTLGGSHGYRCVLSPEQSARHVAAQQQQP